MQNLHHRTRTHIATTCNRTVVFPNDRQCFALDRPIQTLAVARLHKPAMLQVRQGISVGWGDDYGAFLEGQSIDVTGLPSGTYRLTHTVNASGRLRERTRANNSASVRIALYRLNGMLRVRVLAR